MKPGMEVRLRLYGVYVHWAVIEECISCRVIVGIIMLLLNLKLVFSITHTPERFKLVCQVLEH